MQKATDKEEGEWMFDYKEVWVMETRKEEKREGRGKETRRKRCRVGRRRRGMKEEEEKKKEKWGRGGRKKGEREEKKRKMETVEVGIIFSQSCKV